MVRVKQQPERTLVGGRITMRKTTREIIHEVSMDEHHSHQPYNSNSYNYGVENEYMTDEQYYPRLPANRGNDTNFKWSHRVPFQSREVNEYMPEQYSTSRVEDTRDSTPKTTGFIRHTTFLRESDGLHSSIRNREILGDRIENGTERHMTDDSRTKNVSSHSTDYADPSVRNHEGRRIQNVDTMQPHGNISTCSGGIPRRGFHAIASKGTKKRYRPGARALQEIRRYQKTVKLLIPRKPFLNVIREVVKDLYPHTEYRFSLDSLEALREATEAFLVRVFEDASVCATHARRVTVMANDVHLLRMLQRW